MSGIQKISTSPEFSAVFSPINGTDGLQYLYIGQIDLGCWFPDPMASERMPVT
jgi:hypothetical protein